MIGRINAIRNKINNTVPLIHCITNPISINQSANAVIAVGARPIMVEYIKEVSDITVTADALLLNLGNMTSARKKSLLAAAVTAGKNNIPSVLDLVGVSCLKNRREFAKKIMKKGKVSAIKGNYSEIWALFNSSYKCSGIDADDKLSEENVRKAAVELSRRYDLIVLASGKRDIIVSDDIVIHVDNGCKKLSQITGTGCLLGALCACFLAAETNVDAIVSACVTLGICGELADGGNPGNGTFLVRLMDELSLITDEKILKYAKMEVMQNEKA